MYNCVQVLYALDNMMINKERPIYIVQALIVITLICMVFGCSPKDPAEIASKVARDWTANNLDGVSKGIAGQVAGNNPLLETTIATIMSNEIKQRITWEYSQPNKLDEDKYRVIATASTQIEITLLGNYKVSLNYNLEIDTKNKRVLSADMDPGSFAMTKL